jgi:peptide/nickel transport system ATP-binding protein/oligopeptide transport system ATP-binding protein
MVFQDPYMSLDPKMTIVDSVAEPLRLLAKVAKRDSWAAACGLLARVGLRRDQFERYPHELSGGQLQRVAIARAISTDPVLVVCDEPVAALDVSIRAQVLNLLRELQEEREMAYVFISHDLSLVRAIAHDVAIMLKGRIVEYGPADEVLRSPHHPYTRRLLDSIPSPDPTARRLVGPAEVTSAGAGSSPEGC